MKVWKKVKLRRNWLNLIFHKNKKVGEKNVVSFNDRNYKTEGKYLIQSYTFIFFYTIEIVF